MKIKNNKNYLLIIIIILNWWAAIVIIAGRPWQPPSPQMLAHHGRATHKGTASMPVPSLPRWPS
ncbi:hypothetical protein CDL12_03487 [Handroanthus impetiginosus]|uniref:Uncharacterized protein n=1 Tax=Handroanthus impetiginosus TaxID=429701 RepID=A0A2G9I205_9LAMI|nr:hypothetical protein CDL12_03487 [Handroanthus impetiginosus]